MKKIIFSIALVLIACGFSYAQDLRGIDIGTVLNYEQVISIFGEPSRYQESDSGDLGIDKYYHYGENYLHFNDDVFIGFHLRDSGFLAFTTDIEGGLKVGDNLSRLDNFKYGKPKRYQNKYILYWHCDCPVYLKVEDGIIIGIDYHDPM